MEIKIVKWVESPHTSSNCTTTTGGIRVKTTDPNQFDTEKILPLYDWQLYSVYRLWQYELTAQYSQKW